MSIYESVEAVDQLADRHIAEIEERQDLFDGLRRDAENIPDRLTRNVIIRTLEFIGRPG